MPQSETIQSASVRIVEIEGQDYFVSRIFPDNKPPFSTKIEVVSKDGIRMIVDSAKYVRLEYPALVENPPPLSIDMLKAIREAREKNLIGGKTKHKKKKTGRKKSTKQALLFYNALVVKGLSKELIEQTMKGLGMALPSKEETKK